MLELIAKNIEGIFLRRFLKQEKELAFIIMKHSNEKDSRILFFPQCRLILIFFLATSQHNNATNELSLKLEQAKAQQLAQKKDYDLLLSEAKKEIENLKKNSAEKLQQEV